MNESVDHARNAPEAEEKRAGCLMTFGAAIGTWIASCVIALLLYSAIPTILASRLGAVMTYVLVPHLIGFGIARGRIRRGRQLRRTAAIVVATEVGLVLLLLLAAL
jgi:hypothetical protein